MERATPKPSQIDDVDSTDEALVGDEQIAERAHVMMDKAKAVEIQWRHTALNDRISMVRQLLAKIAKVDIVDIQKF